MTTRKEIKEAKKADIKRALELSDKVLEEFKRVLGIDVGETTPDGTFSLDCLRCVGACGLAPVMMINDRTYGSLTPDKTRGILRDLRKEAEEA